MEELNERLAIREERIATRNAVMNGDIRPRINQFRRGAQARTFLNQLTHSSIQNYLPGQKLDYFRKPENRLRIFRSGLIEVLQLLKITTFTREDVFATIRADQIACLRYMLGVHPTMIQDHATTYTAEDIILQLRSNDPAGVLEYMHLLHPTMLEDADLRPDIYRAFFIDYANRGGPFFPNTVVFAAQRQFIDTFRVLNIRIGLMIPPGLFSTMTYYVDLQSVDEYVLTEILQIVLSGNPRQRVNLIPESLFDLMSVYKLLTLYITDRVLCNLLNAHVLPNEVFPRVMADFFPNFGFVGYEFPSFLVHVMNEVQFDDDGIRVGVGNPERVNPLIEALPRRFIEEYPNLFLDLLDLTENADTRRRIRRFAGLDDIDSDSGPDATRPGSRSSSGARFSRAPSSAGASSSAGFFSASPSSAAASSSAGFFSAPSSDPGFFLFSYA
jgi:hypothetical protein